MNALTPDNGPVGAEVLLVGALGQYILRQVVYRIRTVDVVFHVSYRPADHVERIRRPASLCLYCAHDIKNARSYRPILFFATYATFSTLTSTLWALPYFATASNRSASSDDMTSGLGQLLQETAQSTDNK